MPWFQVCLLAARGRKCRFVDAVIAASHGTPRDWTRDPGYVLLLDDFGSERETDSAQGKLGRLLRARYEECAPTIVTTNRPLDLLSEAYPRELGRMGEGIFFEVTGLDRRLTT